MDIDKLAEGFVSQRKKGTPTSVAAGPRSVQMKSGRIICTFVAQAEMGGNDFKPMISESWDLGLTWSEARMLWPELQDRYSIFGSVSGSADGELYFYGMRTPISAPGELAWSAATSGLKQNELVWTHSRDGVHWAPFATIPMPIAGSAEAAGAMCVTRGGHLVCCYAPYNTFDPNIVVQKNQIVCLRSEDHGKSWQHSAMISFPGENSLGAESWVVELSDKRLLGTAWHIDGDVPQTNKYALSSDGGATWTATNSTEILGQSTALAPVEGGRALFVYNQRKAGDLGVWLAKVEPTASSFGILMNRRVWASEVASLAEGSADFKDWTSFAFGEPSVTPLSDGTILVALWAIQPSGQGIRFVKLRLK
jgi:hypothetical protein